MSGDGAITAHPTPGPAAKPAVLAASHPGRVGAGRPGLRPRPGDPGRRDLLGDRARPGRSRRVRPARQRPAPRAPRHRARVRLPRACAWAERRRLHALSAVAGAAGPAVRGGVRPDVRSGHRRGRRRGHQRHPPVARVPATGRRPAGPALAARGVRARERALVGGRRGNGLAVRPHHGGHVRAGGPRARVAAAACVPRRAAPRVGGGGTRAGRPHDPVVCRAALPLAGPLAAEAVESSPSCR